MKNQNRSDSFHSNSFWRGAFGILLAWPLFLEAAAPTLTPPDQEDYERSIEAIVRNKRFYKAKRIELGIYGGLMPYDSLINHYMAAARFTWHVADHFGWEIADGVFSFPKVTGYAVDLVEQNGLSRLETVKIRWMVLSNFLLSPLYGKVRFIGQSVIHFDVYTVAGIGAAGTDVVRLSSAETKKPATETTVKSGVDPVVDLGLGVKVFFSDAMAIVFDMRDYVVTSSVYSKTSIKSNFSVFLGLALFLPSF